MNELIHNHAFYNLVEKLGENITITRIDSDGEIHEYKLKASLVPATSAAYNMTDREYLLKGDMTLPQDLENVGLLSGCYVVRDLKPMEKYILLSVISVDVCDKVSYVYMLQCNTRATICEPVEIEGEYESITNAFLPYAEDIICNFSTVLRSMKSTIDGSLDQTIYTIIMPGKFPISPEQRIIKKNYENGIYKDVNYKVESVSTDMLKINSDTNEYYGIVSAQLSEDLRTDIKTIDDSENLEFKKIKRTYEK